METTFGRKFQISFGQMCESEQLQTLISNLAVCDVSLRLYATSLYATPDPLIPVVVAR